MLALSTYDKIQYNIDDDESTDYMSIKEIEKAKLFNGHAGRANFTSNYIERFLFELINII